MAKRNRQTSATDKAIETFYYKHANCVQINIMDISKIYAAGRSAALAGGDVEAAVVASIAVLRLN